MAQQLSQLHVSGNPNETVLHIRFTLDEVQDVEDALASEEVERYINDIFRMPDKTEDETYLGYMITFNDSFGLWTFAHLLGIQYRDNELADEEKAKPPQPEKFRGLTPAEKEELAAYVLEHGEGYLGDTHEEILQGLEDHPIIAYDNYMSDSVGYSGKFIFAMWGFPEAYEVFTFYDGKLTKINTDLNIG